MNFADLIFRLFSFIVNSTSLTIRILNETCDEDFKDIGSKASKEFSSRIKIAVSYVALRIIVAFVETSCPLCRISIVYLMC